MVIVAMKRWENEGGGRRRIEEARGGGAANVHGWVISATNNLPDMYVCVLDGIFFYSLFFVQGPWRFWFLC